MSPFTLSKFNISESSWPNVIKFHLEHHWGGGLAALGFGPDRIRTLVSMATDSSHREKCCDHSNAFNFECIFFILADKKDNYISLDEFEFVKIPSPVMELAPLEHLKN